MKEKGLKIISGALLLTMTAYTAPVFAYTKDETVYSKLDANGSKYQTIVSTHLKNDKEDETLKDLSDLLNITNTNGDETFEQDGNSLIWQANKEDIYYEGESQKDLPIECNVTYELNGEKIAASELAGKSGEVKITLDYTNKDSHIVNINGKNVKMYTPFVVVAGTIIKNDNNKNITVSNGKLINDGSKTVVIGMAMPGLQESLGVSKKTIEIPSSIEITMDAEDFESSSIITYVTPKVIEEDDLKLFDKIDSLYSKVNTLQESANKLEEGSNQVSSGISTAYDGAKQITTKVNESTKSLKNDKTNALDSKTLAAIEKQAESSSILTDEQKQTIIAAADAGIDAQADTIKEQFVVNAKAIAEQTAIATAKKTANETAKAVAMQTAMDTAKSVAMASAKNANPNLTQEELQAIGTAAANNAKLSTEQLNAIGKQAENLSDAKIKQIKAEADAGIEAQRTTIEKQGIASAKAIAEQTALTSAQAATTLAAKKTATSVAATVGNKVKLEASKKVAFQMSTLGDGLEQLTSGLNELNNGSSELAEGMTKFNNEGIKQICNYINGDVKDITTRVQKLSDLSKQYNNFTMLNGNNEGNVKFIMIIDAIKKQEDTTKEQAILNNSEDNKNENKENN